LLQAREAGRRNHSARAMVRAAGRRPSRAVRARREIQQRAYEQADGRRARASHRRVVRCSPRKLADGSRSARSCRRRAARSLRRSRMTPVLPTRARSVTVRDPTATGRRREDLRDLMIRACAGTRVTAYRQGKARDWVLTAPKHSAAHQDPTTATVERDRRHCPARSQADRRAARPADQADPRRIRGWYREVQADRVARPSHRGPAGSCAVGRRWGE
jgi:hypothetical protein